MEKIASFQIDHDVLVPGIYVSRIDMGDIVTYDLRFKKPNADDYLSPESAHTIEHIFATYLRSSEIADKLVYFGPMGCLTGCYLIAKGASHSDVIANVVAAAEFTAAFSGKIPGSEKIECGNYAFHDLAAAKQDAAAFLAAIAFWTEDDLVYPTAEECK